MRVQYYALADVIRLSIVSPTAAAAAAGAGAGAPRNTPVRSARAGRAYQVKRVQHMCGTVQCSTVTPFIVCALEKESSSGHVDCIDEWVEDNWYDKSCAATSLSCSRGKWRPLAWKRWVKRGLMRAISHASYSSPFQSP